MTAAAQPLRLAVMGTPEFAVPSLAALLRAGHTVAAVYAQPPRPAGRGHKERRSPVHAAAAAHGLAVRTPARLKDPAEHRAFAALDLDAAVVAAYGLILPPPILRAPRLGCVNVHASLLPRWRGAAPIQRAILAGDPVSGVTIMRMDEGLDTGPMLLRTSTAIGPATNAGKLRDALAATGARMIVDALARLESGRLDETPQPDQGITYAAKIDKAETRIDWARPAAGIERQLRAFAPVPGAWFELDGERIRALAGTVTNGSGKPGTLLDDALTVACGEGAIRLDLVQRAGKGAMQAAAFLRGRAVPAGTMLA